MNPSKLLLLGEYSVLFGGDCLAVPYTHFFGELSLGVSPEDKVEQITWSNKQIESFNEYLTQNLYSNDAFQVFDSDKLAFDLAKGLWFKSNIPHKSGFGSSGALIASLVKGYADVAGLEDNGNKLKTFLSMLESFFHGSSSGIDPLVSYKNCPVAYSSGKTVFPNLQNMFPDNVQFFLIQTKQDKKTKYLVAEFLKQAEDKVFKESFTKELISESNSIIHCLINQKSINWVSRLASISDLQRRYFKDVLSTDLISVMKVGTDSKLFSLKLLGSGGGFMLGCTEDIEATLKTLDRYNIPVFQYISKKHLVLHG